MKTPEEYFNEQIFAPEQETAGNALEDSFLRKFLGQAEAGVVQEVSSERSSDQKACEGVQAARVLGNASQTGHRREEKKKAPAAKNNIRGGARQEIISASLQEKFVGVEVSGQEFALSILEIKEVIKRCQTTRLPNAPSFIAGVASLRGKITPVLHMNELLGVQSCSEANFVVICRYKDLQIGLLVDKICSMYKVESARINREFDARFGGGNFFSALLNLADRLLPVVSVEQIVRTVLQLE